MEDVVSQSNLPALCSENIEFIELLPQNRTLADMLDHEATRKLFENDVWRQRVCSTMMYWLDDEKVVAFEQFCTDYNISLSVLLESAALYPQLAETILKAKVFIAYNVELGNLYEQQGLRPKQKDSVLKYN